MFQNLYASILPHICCLCDNKGTNGLDLCVYCHKNLPWNLSCCHKCACPLPDQRRINDQCGRCLNNLSDIDRSIIPFLYRPPVDFMVRRLKFSSDTKFSRLAGELISHAVSSQAALENDLPDLLLPVPINSHRLMQRGFNQAALIADVVAERLSIQCSSGAVQRINQQLQQSGLSARDRETNIRRAFSVTGEVEGLHVAIIDDVYTTGATARAIARQLRRAKASKISVWAFARTP